MHFILILLSFVFTIESEQSFRYFEDEEHQIELEKASTRIHSGRASLERKVSLKEPSQYSSYLLAIFNSTAGINSVLFETDGLSVARIDSNSYVLIRHCTIDINERNSSSGFICDGEIVIEGVEVHSHYPIRSIIESSGEWEGITEISSRSPFSLRSVSIKWSKMGDMEVYRSEGGIISGRGIIREGVIGCLFMNVNMSIMAGEKEEKGKRREIRREETDIRESIIFRVEGGIYGVIGGGEMEGEGEGYSFVSSNNTIVYSYVRKVDDRVRMNEEYKDTNYTSQISLNNTSSHTFINCTFTSSSSAFGGAIYFNSSSTTTYTVTITSCTFTNCSVGLTGGAVYCSRASSCVVTGCSFVECKSTSDDHSSGGIYMSDISRCAAVKDSNFSSCTASSCGGVYIKSSNVTGSDCEGGVEYGIVSGCRFSDCNATDYHGGGICLDTVLSGYNNSRL